MLNIEVSKCTGCRMCEASCSLAHFDACGRQYSRIRVAKNEEAGEDKPLVCRQCAEAPCIEACPELALNRDGSNSATVLSGSVCTGCLLCVSVCPHAGIFVGPSLQPEPVLICDLCGGDPQCVRYCETGALSVRQPAEARG